MFLKIEKSIQSVVSHRRVPTSIVCYPLHKCCFSSSSDRLPFICVGNQLKLPKNNKYNSQITQFVPIITDLEINVADYICVICMFALQWRFVCLHSHAVDLVVLCKLVVRFNSILMFSCSFHAPIIASHLFFVLKSFFFFIEGVRPLLRIAL
jgi:hypothetical protein